MINTQLATFFTGVLGSVSALIASRWDEAGLSRERGGGREVDTGRGGGEVEKGGREAGRERVSEACGS